MSVADDSYPWPQKGDDPFALDSTWRDNACVNFFGGDEPWSFYAQGYKLAGDLSVAHVEATGRYQDRLVYPTLFNYRQYIELSLKGRHPRRASLLGRERWCTLRPRTHEPVEHRSPASLSHHPGRR